MANKNTIFKSIKKDKSFVQALVHAKIKQNGKKGLIIIPDPNHSISKIPGVECNNQKSLIILKAKPVELINLVNEFSDILNKAINEAKKHYFEITGKQPEIKLSTYEQLHRLKGNLNDIPPDTIYKAMLKIAEEIETTGEKIVDIDILDCTYPKFCNIKNRLKNLQAKHNKSKQAA